MTREDIIKLMRESCDTDKSEPWDNGFWTVTQEELERFAARLLREQHAEIENLISRNQGLAMQNSLLRATVEAMKVTRGET